MLPLPFPQLLPQGSVLGSHLQGLCGLCPPQPLKAPDHHPRTGLGIYKRKKENTQERKQELVQENTHENTQTRTRTRKHARKKELVQESVHANKNSCKKTRTKTRTRTRKRPRKKELVQENTCFLVQVLVFFLACFLFFFYKFPAQNGKNGILNISLFLD